VPVFGTAFESLFLLNSLNLDMRKSKKSFVQGLLSVFKESFLQFNNDKVVKLSAALAYYTIFSLAPMLVVIISLCSIFFGREAVQGEIFSQIDQFVGSNAAAEIQDILKKTTLNHDNILATVVGVITLLLGATGVFGEIQDSINFIWGLQTKPKKGIIKMLFNRLMSFSMVLVLGFLLLVSLVLNTFLSTFLAHLKSHLPDSLVDNLFVFDYLFILSVITLLFAFIFKALPDAKVKWADVWLAALITSVMFLIGKFLIGIYLQHNASISAYGAAGSVIVILLWVYFSALILYFGAEFAQVYTKYKGRSIEPNRYATWVEKNVTEKKSNIQVDKSAERK
jgi:membrane protein